MEAAGVVLVELDELPESELLLDDPELSPELPEPDGVVADEPPRLSVL